MSKWCGQQRTGDASGKEAARSRSRRSAIEKLSASSAWAAPSTAGKGAPAPTGCAGSSCAGRASGTAAAPVARATAADSQARPLCNVSPLSSSVSDARSAASRMRRVRSAGRSAARTLPSPSDTPARADATSIHSRLVLLPSGADPTRVLPAAATIWAAQCATRRASLHRSPAPSSITAARLVTKLRRRNEGKRRARSGTAVRIAAGSEGADQTEHNLCAFDRALLDLTGLASVTRGPQVPSARRPPAARAPDTASPAAARRRAAARTSAPASPAPAPTPSWRSCCRCTAAGPPRTG